MNCQSPKPPSLSRSTDLRLNLESIWQEFGTRLGEFVRARVADPAAAEDILQNVFVKVQGRLDEFRDPTKLRGWLFLVARNAIIDRYRTSKKTLELPEWLPSELPENPSETEELRRVFHRLIDQVPTPYREALLLT